MTAQGEQDPAPASPFPGVWVMFADSECGVGAGTQPGHPKV